MNSVFAFITTFLVISSAFAAGNFPFGKQASIEAIQRLLLLSREQKIEQMQSEGLVVRVQEFANSEIRGQFLDLAHYPNLQRPEIHFSPQADEWTYVHEYIHYLFSLRASSEPVISESIADEAQKTLTNRWQEYESNRWRYTSAQHRQQVTDSFLIVAKSSLQNLASFELEELAIENYLREVYRTQRPSGFDEKAWDRSSRYMKKSGTAALGLLRELSVSCSELQTSYTPEHLELPQDVQATCQKIQSLRDEVTALTKAAQIRIYLPMGDK